MLQPSDLTVYRKELLSLSPFMVMVTLIIITVQEYQHSLWLWHYYVYDVLTTRELTTFELTTFPLPAAFLLPVPFVPPSRTPTDSGGFGIRGGDCSRIPTPSPRCTGCFPDEDAGGTTGSPASVTAAPEAATPVVEI